MVMENPSPASVGREFVRQYYTLLHEAPVYLHRFYSHDSSFVHGGVEQPGQEQPPVRGQQDIHKKIMSLGFKDCHAKIRQVDSQSTVGNGVVVQVTGELSNNGEPMRRFMQTFILAPQSAKKYYLHNDIFRYQDEVFPEDSDTENTEEHGDSEQENVVVENGSPEQVATDPPAAFFEQPPMSNGSAHSEEVEDLGIPKGQEEVKESDLPAEDEDKSDKEEEKMEEKSQEPQLEQDPPVEKQAFSWAALASKNTPSAAPMSTVPVQPPVKSPATRLETKPETGTGGPNQQPQPQRTPRPPRDRYQDRERTSLSRGEGDGDTDSLSGRRGSRYPDSHQLFVGNLPHNITERELKSFFEQYGNVVELRINTKSSGGKLPNFGFVVFDSPDPVQDILKIKEKQPIKYNGEHRLNVEEKKPRGDGRGMGPGRGGMRGGMSGSNMGRPGVGGPGRGGMRGGGPGRPEGRGPMVSGSRVGGLPKR